MIDRGHKLPLTRQAAVLGIVASWQARERRAFSVQSMHPIKDKRVVVPGSTVYRKWDGEVSASRLRVAPHSYSDSVRTSMTTQWTRWRTSSLE